MRYLDYSYWVELSGGSRRPTDAAARIKAGLRAFDVPNEPFVDAAHAVIGGERFPPLILVGERQDNLVCLEGHLRLTAYALVGFPTDIKCGGSRTRRTTLHCRRTNGLSPLRSVSWQFTIASVSSGSLAGTAVPTAPPSGRRPRPWPRP